MGFDMKWQLQRIVVTDGGVYRPPPLALEAAVVAIVVLVIGVAFAMGRLWVPNLLLDAAVIGALVAVRAQQYRRHRGDGCWR
jgi:hypothetical protein